MKLPPTPVPKPNKSSNKLSNYNDNQATAKPKRRSNKNDDESKGNKVYNTRAHKRFEESKRKAAKIRQPLQELPELLPDIPQNVENNIKFHHLKTKNEQIIQQKYSTPTYNKHLFVPTNLPINDQYDIANITNSAIKEKQCSDALLHAIIEFLAYDNKFDLEGLPKFLYNTVLTGRYYLTMDKLLKYRYKERDCIVVPASLRYSVLRWAHSAMHHGKDKMIRRLTSRFWWPYFRNDVISFCQTCHQCQCVKKGRDGARKSGKLHTFDAKAPFELVSIDIVGPLPMTDSGNRYIVTMIDKFTRFCLLIPVKDIKAFTVIRAYERWVTLFGPPRRLLSDNGSQFISEIFRHYTNATGTTQTFTSPYYPECNGQIERLHRWMKERLCLISVDVGVNFVDEDNWDDYIPMIQHSYNATPNSMTTYSPNKILFGVDMEITLDKVNNKPLSPRTPDEYVEAMNNNRSIINNEVNKYQQKYRKSRTATYNKRRSDSIEYEVGDVVLVDVSKRLVGNNKSLNPQYVGPFEIIQNVGESGQQFVCREIGNESNVRTENIHALKPYKIAPYLNVLFQSYRNPQCRLDHNSNYIIQYIFGKYSEFSV